MSKLLAAFSVLLALTGMMMLSAPASAQLEAGAHAAWESSAPGGDCKVSYHSENPAPIPVRENWRNGHGAADGGVVGVHYCYDITNAQNVCDANIDGQYDFKIVGQLRQDC